MTIADNLKRISDAKAAIKTSLENKGVEVSDSALLDEYATLIDSIKVGEGGGDPYYEYLFNAKTSNGKYFRYLLYGSFATEFDLTNLDTNKATNMEYMFSLCANLTSIDVSNFNTSNVTTMSYMFSNCSSLTELDLSNWDTSNVTNMSGMFTGCSKLTSIKGLNNWDTSSLVNMSNMFPSSNLASLDISNWDVGHITTYYYIESAFNNCKNLVDFYPPKNINCNLDFTSSTALSHDSLIRIINNLVTLSSGTKTLKLGATNLAKLTDEEIAMATAKGWTVK